MRPSFVEVPGFEVIFLLWLLGGLHGGGFDSLSVGEEADLGVGLRLLVVGDVFLCSIALRSFLLHRLLLVLLLRHSLILFLSFFLSSFFLSSTLSAYQSILLSFSRTPLQT